MALADGLRAEQIIELARKRFQSALSEIEVQVIYHSCRYDNPKDWISPQDEVTETDVASPRSTFASNGRPEAQWQGPELRTSFLRWLLTDIDATSLLEHRGLRVWSARFTEALDLSHCRIPVRVEFRYCLFAEKVDFTSAEIISLFIKESLFTKEIDAVRLTLKGPLFVRGVLACDFANFNQVKVGAEITMADTYFCNPTRCFSLTGANVEDDIFLTPRFRSLAGLNLDSIRVGGSVYFEKARISTIRMVSATLGKQLSLNGAKILGTGDSILMDGSRIGGSANFKDRFRCRGRISLRGAVIDGSLQFDSGILTTSGVALSLEGARIRVAAFLRYNFATRGEVNMHGVEIGGQLDCENAKFLNPRERLSFRPIAFSLEASVIGGHVLLTKGFYSFRTVRLSGARIGGQLSCEGSHIRALVAENVEIRGDLFWRGIVEPCKTALRLTGTKVRFLRDDRASWPPGKHLEVTGFVAEDLRLAALEKPNTWVPVLLSARDRIEWLNLQPEPLLADPQPWVQVAKLLEIKGHTQDAKRVLLELRKHQSRLRWEERRGKWIGQALDRAFALLEERPLRILLPLLFCVLFGSSLFWPMQGRFSPKTELTDKSTIGISKTLPDYPKFQPVIYTLENVLPVVKLGQDDLWAPDPLKSSKFIYWSLMLVRWFLIIAGYIQGGILAAALGARFRS